MVKDTKVIDGIRRRAKDGKLVGRVPYGYILRDGEIEIIPEEADIIQQIFRLYYEEKMGFADISYFLNTQELFRRGNPWRRDSVKRTLENRVYYGKVKVKEEEFYGDFPSIIEEEYIEVGESIERRKKEKSNRGLQKDTKNSSIG